MSLETLRRWEKADLLARDRIGNSLLRFKFLLPDVDLGDTFDAPTNGEIDFLLLPIFGEDSAPDCTHEAVDRRERSKEEPGDESECGREDEEGKVGLREGEVEGNLLRSVYAHLQSFHRAHLLAKAVPDVVQVLSLEEVLRRPFLDPILVVGMVVQGKDRLDILPFALLGCDTSTTLRCRVCDELVYDA